MEDSKSKFSPLYDQSVEIEFLYSQPIEKDSIEISKYYLVPKSLVESFMNKSNYNNYNNLKNISQKLILKSKNFSFSESMKNDFSKIENYNISYPINFFPIKETFFKDNNEFISNNSENLYELIIGENNIFVFDNKSNNTIFICSITSDNDQLDDFIVNVDYILIYNDKNTFINEMEDYICDGKGIKNYFLKRNLTIEENEVKNINDGNKKIGILYTISDNNYQTPDGFNIEYIKYEEEPPNINASVSENIDFSQIKSINTQIYNNNISKNNIYFLNLSLCYFISGRAKNLF
jgi:hypothetical protein